MKTPLAITGTGLTTSLGPGIEENWRRLRAGESGIGPVRSIPVDDYPVQDGGEVDDPPEMPPHRDGRPATPELCHLLQVAREALEPLEKRGVRPGPPERLGICIGSSLAASTITDLVFQSRRDRGEAEADYALLRGYHMDRHFQYLADQLGFEGPAVIISNACAAGAGALARAEDWIRSGRCDAVLALGYDAFSIFTFAGFGSLFALSEDRTRPFAGDRDGMKIGAGFAAVLLQPLEAARELDLEVQALLSGYGESSDAHHLTHPHPEGRGAARAMREALRRAGLEPSDISVINCHATATPSNDAAEAAGLATVFGKDLERIPVYAPKPAVGHTLGGAGTVEAVLSILFLRHQVLAPTLNVTPADIDPGIGLPLDLTTTARPMEIRHVMSNSFGFGGSNASLILSAPSTWKGVAS